MFGSKIKGHGQKFFLLSVNASWHRNPCISSADTLISSPGCFTYILFLWFWIVCKCSCRCWTCSFIVLVLVQISLYFQTCASMQTLAELHDRFASHSFCLTCCSTNICNDHCQASSMVTSPPVTTTTTQDPTIASKVKRLCFGCQGYTCITVS